MPTFNLHVFIVNGGETKNGKVIINMTIPVLDCSTSLADTVREEIVRESPGTKYSNDDIVEIKSVQTKRNVIRLLGLPMSTVLDAISDENPHGLDVVIGLPIISSHHKKIVNPFKLMMDASKVTGLAFKSTSL